MDKFGRNYILRISTPSSGVITVTLPFTLEIDITRNTLTSANICQLRIYNLSEKNRNLIRFNVYDFRQFQSVELFAGYGANPPRIFRGNITQAWSVRQGVDFITQIECLDGGFAFVNGNTNTAFPAGTAQRDVIKALTGTLPHVEPGAVGAYPGELSRGNSYSGNTADILKDLTGGGFFIDNGRANALGNSEYIAAVDGTTLISSKSGLLGTPVLERNIVRFEMLFEPGLNAGHKIRLDSITGSNFNGDYIVTAVKHRGMISEAVCGSMTTMGEFLYIKQPVPVQ